MKYFVTVNTLNSTTKLGKLLANSVFSRYNNSLIYHCEASTLPKYLTDEMATLIAENKRLKPMLIKTHGFDSAGKLQRYATATIWATTETGTKAFTDNRPFTITLTPVMKDYTEKTSPTIQG